MILRSGLKILLAAALGFLAVKSVFATGGNVSGTPTGQAQTGTANRIPKYQSNGQLGNGSVSDDGTNILPVTNNAENLGNTSNEWQNVETFKLNSGGSDITEGTAGVGNLQGTGQGTAPSQLAVAGTVVMQPFQFGTGQTGLLGIYVSSTIPVGSNYVLLLSSGGGGGGNLVMTALPAISTTTSFHGATAIADGTLLVITSTASASITLQDNGTLSGSLLNLGAATRAITSKRILTLIFSKTLGLWREQSYTTLQ